MENLEIRFPNQIDCKVNNKPSEHINSSIANIKIIGVGGAGTNAITRMITANISNVKLFAVNTDKDSLQRSAAENRIVLGNGLGVGGDPEKGEQFAKEDKAIEKFKDMLQGADMVFITTGMGGGTGTGAAPIIAKVSKELGILTVGVVTRPFTNEGSQRVANANKGIAKLREYTDALIVIPNDKLFTLVDEKTHYEKGFEIIDDVLRRAIESITDTITKTGIVNIDFADVKGVLSNADNAIIGLGDGQTFEEAFNKAITNKFVEGEDIVDANKVLVNVSYSNTNEIKVGDIKFIYDYVAKEFKHYSSLKVGNTDNNNLDTKIRVAIIASFQKQEEQEEPNDDLFKNIDNQKQEEKENFNKSNEKESLFSKPAYETHKPSRL